MNKIVKFLNIVMIAIALINILYICYYEVSAASYQGMVSDAQAFINKGKSEVSKANGVQVGDITKEFVPIGQMLTSIGAGVLVAVTTYMGIKYITSGPEAQAKLKQQLIGVIVSGVVIFGAYGIWQVVVQIAQTFEQ